MLNTILLPTVNVLAIIITITTLSARKATIDHWISLDITRCPFADFCQTRDRVFCTVYLTIWLLFSMFYSCHPQPTRAKELRRILDLERSRNQK